MTSAIVIAALVAALLQIPGAIANKLAGDAADAGFKRVQSDFARRCWTGPTVIRDAGGRLVARLPAGATLCSPRRPVQ